MSTKCIINYFSSISKRAKFRVLQFYPLKMNLVLEIRLVLTLTNAGRLFLDLLLFYK